MFTHLGVASKRGIWTQVCLDPKPMVLKSLQSEAEKKSVCQRITYKKVIIISLKKKEIKGLLLTVSPEAAVILNGG